MMIMLACISLGGTHAPPWDAHEFGEMEFWASFLSLKQRVASRVLHFSLVPNKKERLVTEVPWQVGSPLCVMKNFHLLDSSFLYIYHEH